MLNEKIDKYNELVNSATFWQELPDISVHGNLVFIFIAVLLLGNVLGFILTIYTIVLIAMSRFKREILFSTVKETKARLQARLGDGVTVRTSDAVLATPRVIIPLTLILVISGISAIKIESSHNAYSREIKEAKSEVVPLVFSEYLDKYNDIVLSTKESVAPSAVEYGKLYTISFNIDGVQYNNRVVYVTYNDKFPTDTLIPFDASDYENLIPTDSQRENSQGFYLTAYNLSNLHSKNPYIDEVDYIYNIKIADN